MSDETSIHRRMPRLMVELEDFQISNDDPRRYAYRKMRDSAWAALDHGARAAAEIIDAMRAMRHVDAECAQQQPTESK